MANSSKWESATSKGISGTNFVNETLVKVTSPISNSSGGSLHEDESSDIRSDGDRTQSLKSPLSPQSLDFENLTIDDAGVRFAKDSVGRYTAPFQRGIKNYNDSNFYSYPYNDIVRRERSIRTRGPSNGRGGSGSGGLRNSRTWMSTDTQAMQKFMVIRNSMRRQFKNADVAKWKYSDYIAHREAIVASQANKLANKVKARESVLSLCIPSIPLETQQSLNKWGLFGNFDQHGNLSRVLGEQTIWCHDWENGKDDIAPWPSTAESKWEGDDRAKTGVGRFLPLPRELGPPGLAWNTLPCVEQYPIDQVARIPTMEDVYLPVDDQIEDEMEYLWSKDLEEAMEAFLETW
jgi:hypothetical protein